MVHEPKTIRVDPETELSPLLAEAASTPVRLEKDGVVYRLVREDHDLWTDYDPDAVHRVLHTYASTLSRQEGEALKAYLSHAREEGTRPLDRP